MGGNDDCGRQIAQDPPPRSAEDPLRIRGLRNRPQQTDDSHGAGGTVDYPPIGKPIPGVVAYVLDGSGAQVPDGVPGRLHLGDSLRRMKAMERAMVAIGQLPAS